MLQYKTEQIVDQKATGQLAYEKRVKNRLSLRDVADLMGCSAAFLSELERGHKGDWVKWQGPWKKAMSQLVKE